MLSVEVHFGERDTTQFWQMKEVRVIILNMVYITASNCCQVSKVLVLWHTDLEVAFQEHIISFDMAHDGWITNNLVLFDTKLSLDPRCRSVRSRSSEFFNKLYQSVK